MKYRFFTVPVIGGEEAEADLNKFMNENKVAAVERRFVDDGAASLRAICVSVVDTTASKASTGPKKQSVDYREVLNDADFAVFARLRTLRKELAEREGVPPYAIFTNEQLAAIVQRRVSTKTAMRDIAGIGDARIEKYAPPVLDLLASAYADHELCPTHENGAVNGAA
jgi:superfamily II DNA helicase RecQ